MAETTTGLCPLCHGWRAFARPSIPLSMGFFLTVLTFGLFLPFWLMHDIGRTLRKFACPTCGTRMSKRELREYEGAA